MTDPNRRPSPEELYATNTVSALMADATTATELGFLEDAELFRAAAKVGYETIRNMIFDKANQIALKDGPYWDTVQAQIKEAEERKSAWAALDGQPATAKDEPSN